MWSILTGIVWSLINSHRISHTWTEKSSWHLGIHAKLPKLCCWHACRRRQTWTGQKCETEHMCWKSETEVWSCQASMFQCFFKTCGCEGSSILQAVELELGHPVLSSFPMVNTGGNCCWKSCLAEHERRNWNRKSCHQEQNCPFHNLQRHMGYTAQWPEVGLGNTEQVLEWSGQMVEAGWSPLRLGSWQSTGSFHNRPSWEDGSVICNHRIGNRIIMVY